MTDIVTPPIIPTMPPAPVLTDTQADFNSKAYATVQAWPNFITQTNAAAAATKQNATASEERATSAGTSATSAANSSTAAAAARDLAQAFAQSAINAPGANGTSLTPQTVSAGIKTFWYQTGKAWVTGQSVIIARASASASVRMYAVVLGYNATTGELVVDVPAGAFVGSGTFSDWVISLTATREGMVRMGAGPNQLANPISLGLHTSGANIRASVDGVDFGAILTDAQMLEFAPPGKRGEFYMNSPPPGWFKSNGAGLSVASYPRLFARIGYFYGGSGDTFYLPNDNGLFPRGWDETGVYDPGRAFGSVQGPANLWHNHGGATHDAGWHNHAGSIDGAGSHGHVVNDPGHNHQVSRYWGRAGARDRIAAGEDVVQGSDPTSSSGTGIWLSADGYHNHGVSIAGNGLHGHGLNGDGLSESRPWNRAVLVCIKY